MSRGAARAIFAWQVRAAAGSSLFYLSFGGNVDRETRRAIARAVDRSKLIGEVELGFADATSSWAARALTSWPSSRFEGRAPEKNDVPEPTPLTIVVGEKAGREIAIAEALREQLAGLVTLELQKTCTIIIILKPGKGEVYFEPRSHGELADLLARHRSNGVSCDEEDACIDIDGVFRWVLSRRGCPLPEFAGDVRSRCHLSRSLPGL